MIKIFRHKIVHFGPYLKIIQQYICLAMLHSARANGIYIVANLSPIDRDLS